jgi:hypothetical protein
LGLEKPNSGPDPGGTFFPNSVSDLGSAGTFPKSRNVGPVIDKNVCLLDSQPWLKVDVFIILVELGVLTFGEKDQSTMYFYGKF